MSTLIDNMKKGLRVKSDARKIYRALQKHFNTMPIGYPAAITGADMRLLQHMFTTEEAQAALNIGWRLETFEKIFHRARQKGYTEEKFRKLIDSMDANGCIFSTIENGQMRYAWQPLYIGMYEMQLRRLTPGMYLDIRDYAIERFTTEYLSTKVRQMRVVPIQTSVTPQLSIAAYDDIRQLVDKAQDRIGITDCICKVGKDHVGKPCRVTNRREVCMGFRDYHDIYKRNGWGHSITKKEAFEILNQNEKDGLILMPTSLQDPQFVCSCCACCCGILEMVNAMPRSVDFVESNYRAILKPETCTGCGRCKKRCQMQAIRFDDDKAVAIDERKCIGCGLCVPTCKANSLSMVRKDKEFVPPKDIEDLYTVIDRHKKSTMGKYAMMLKAMIGREV